MTKSTIETATTTTDSKTQRTVKMKSPKMTKKMTIREKAAQKSDLTPEQIRVATEGYEERLRQVTTVVMTANELATLKVADDYQREEKKSHIVRLAGVLLGKGEFLPPIIVARREGTDGQVRRYIVDGQQRRRALVEAGLPQLVIEVPFASVEEEKVHFLGIQRGMTVNASHIVEVCGSDLSAEILRIAKQDGHPAKGRIFFGKGVRKPNQLPAKSVENLVARYKLPKEDLANFLGILMSAFGEHPIPVSAVTAAMLRGFVGFYLKNRTTLDPRDAMQMRLLHHILTAEKKFPRRGDNSATGAEHCQRVIASEFRATLANETTA